MLNIGFGELVIITFICAVVLAPLVTVVALVLLRKPRKDER